MNNKPTLVQIKELNEQIEKRANYNRRLLEALENSSRDELITAIVLHSFEACGEMLNLIDCIHDVQNNPEEVTNELKHLLQKELERF